MRSHGLKLPEGRLVLDIWNIFFSKRVVMQWHSCSWSWGGSLSLEGFQNHRDVALRDVGSRHGGGGLGLDCGI